MDSVDQSWDRIEAWIAANEPELATAFNPGATEEEMYQAEAAMEGLVLPEDVKASYRRHNGGSFLMNQDLFSSLDGMYLGQAGLETRYGEALKNTPEHLFGPIQPVWRHPAWLTLAGNGAGDEWCIDLAPAPGGQVGQIIAFSHEIGPTEVLAPSLQALLATFAYELESDKYTQPEEEDDGIWEPAHRTRRNWDRVRECTEPASPLISTRTLIPRNTFVDSINRLYRDVRAYLDRQAIQPRVDYRFTPVLARYEDAGNELLLLEVGITVQEARSDDPRMLVGTLPGGPAATLPQTCHLRLPHVLISEEADREMMGPADPRLIAEEGMEALEEWSDRHHRPLTGQPWLIFLVDPHDPQAVPIPDPMVFFDVYRLLAPGE